MTPVPASKKFWVFDGSVEQYPSVFVNGNVHYRDCTDCHGGVDSDSANSRALAHADEEFAGIATAESCSDCHRGIELFSADGLHTTLGGYHTVLEQRDFDMSDPVSAQRFGEQCTKCHTAALGSDGFEQTACGQCHVSVPVTAGGGLISGHAFNEIPSMDNNCTACHGSRVKDEYFGLNNALLERNKAAFTASSPWAGDYQLVPDVHKTWGYTCVDCHTTPEGGDYFGDEMHGVGHPLPGNGDRYNVDSAPRCLDCHDTSSFASIAMHSDPHLESMECQVCHVQPYKNCFGCHTDVTVDDPLTPEVDEGGLPYYTINEASPAVSFDSLMTFRAGINPKGGEEGRKPYAVLRHAPVDEDVFRYSGDNAVDGILSLNNQPTWKYATPHNIVRWTPITASCDNCHGEEYSRLWLTDPIADAQGWVGSDYAAGENAANTSVTVPSPPAPYPLPD